MLRGILYSKSLLASDGGSGSGKGCSRLNKATNGEQSDAPFLVVSPAM